MNSILQETLYADLCFFPLHSQIDSNLSLSCTPSDHNFLYRMGRKRTAEELNSIPDANSFVAGAYEEDPFQQQRDEYSRRYPKNQEESLNLWMMCSE